MLTDTGNPKEHLGDFSFPALPTALPVLKVEMYSYKYTTQSIVLKWT